MLESGVAARQLDPGEGPRNHAGSPDWTAGHVIGIRSRTRLVRMRDEVVQFDAVCSTLGMDTADPADRTVGANLGDNGALRVVKLPRLWLRPRMRTQRFLLCPLLKPFLVALYAD